MKLNTLNKIPANVRGAISMWWNETYQNKTISASESAAFVAGMIETLFLLKVITYCEFLDVCDYYEKWFTL